MLLSAGVSFPPCWKWIPSKKSSSGCARPCRGDRLCNWRIKVFLKKRSGKHKLRNKIEILVLLVAGGEALTAKYCVAAYDTAAAAVVVVLLLSLLILLLCFLPLSFKFLYIFEDEYFSSSLNETLFFS